MYPNAPPCALLVKLFARVKFSNATRIVKEIRKLNDADKG